MTDPRVSMEFQNLAGIYHTVTFRDWNTIVATSKVPECDNLAIDPGIGLNPSATLVQRLRYLADLVGMQDGETGFEIVQLYRNSSDTKAVADVLAVNGSQTAQNVTRLHVTVWNEQKAKKFLDGNFFPPRSPLSVPAKTSVFTALVFPEGIPPSFPRRWYAHFEWG